MPPIDEIISRMILATGAKNQQEMLDFTGLASGLASNWRKRGRVPEKSIAKVAEVAGVNFRWLLTGEGEMRTTDSFGHSLIGEPPITHLSGEQRRLLDAYAVANPEIKKAAMRMLEESANESRRNVGGGSSSAGKKSA